MATQLLLRYSYPKQPGDQPWSIIDVTGPTSYVPLAPGTPPTGGQVINASDFGLQAIDVVMAQGSSDGRYSGMIPSGVIGGDSTTVRLAWVNVAGGQAAAASDLSPLHMRLLAIGR